MDNLIENVKWTEKTEKLDELIRQGVSLHAMNQGFEAEVVKVSSAAGEHFVLKRWNKSSRPDVGFQFRLLNALLERGVSVARPLGWGFDESGAQAMLTSFDGAPVGRLNKRKVIDIAKLLSSLHRIPMDELAHLPLPAYDFADYFFPGVKEKEHEDIREAVHALVRQVEIKQDRVIHGDFHLANLLEEEDGRLTVIDWTNGQAGDASYDFAWSYILMSIYVSEGHADTFRTAYLSSNNDIRQHELDVFEALACLRWMLLQRNGGVPLGPDTMAKVNRLATNNPHLHALELAK
ncbi:aminoglycoside phosphotransferase family protein [Paenibacillus sp. LHD-117]|uniref:phosphotransferase family protein n=1 Tax=Paenibacillus sp. LHD-117 TaxID=3071412 RepID=UPI0027E20C40|nr:aminoglycoside phosphotransferase family protein [Paenibacillus sp. LHD-117]MDQ6419568.1 aminoglycoside phosphotransferase family protein [Paenibacillus sp. LHD-117]